MNAEMVDRSTLDLGLSTTFAYSRLQCVGWMYPIHILAAYLMVLTGLVALIFRVVPKYKKYHALMGRLFVVFMFWGYCTSLVIHTAGLPISILIFMFTKVIGLTVGLLAIGKHKEVRQAEVMQRVSAAFKADSGPNRLTLEEMFAKQRQIVESERTTLRSRFLTWKALHGIAMSYAWFTMTGRSFVTNPVTSWEGCWSYPVRKTVDGVVDYLPREEPGRRTINQDLAFAFGIFALGMVLTIGTGLVYSWHAAKKTREANAAGAGPVGMAPGSGAELGSVAVKKLDDSDTESASSGSSRGARMM